MYTSSRSGNGERAIEKTVNMNAAMALPARSHVMRRENKAGGNNPAYRRVGRQM
jgi:hypothetical protein